MSVTMLDLIARCARRMGDTVPLKATQLLAAGKFSDESTTLEELRHWPGSQVLILSGDYAGSWGNVLSVSADDELNVSPAFPGQIQVGTDAMAVRLRSKGWEVREYFAAINDAIMDLRKRVLIKASVENAVAFSKSLGSIEPDELSPGVRLEEVYSVDVYDTRSRSWLTIRQNRYDGWWPNGSGIEISGCSRDTADGRIVRFRGYYYQPQLTSMSSVCLIAEQPVIAKACLDLNHGGVDRDSKFPTLYQKQEAEFERELRGYTTWRVDGTRRIYS